MDNIVNKLDEIIKQAKEGKVKFTKKDLRLINEIQNKIKENKLNEKKEGERVELMGKLDEISKWFSWLVDKRQKPQNHTTSFIL